MSRNQAIDELQKSSEGKIPWKYVPDFLNYLQISEQQFLENLDRFTNKRIFEVDSKGRLRRDTDGNLIRKFFPEKI